MTGEILKPGKTGESIWAYFLGNNANAVQWQLWMALLAYGLLRYHSYLSEWLHSVSRLCTMVRGVLWEKVALRELLESCGTAAGSFRLMSRPDQAYLPDFEGARYHVIGRGNWRKDLVLERGSGEALEAAHFEICQRQD